MTRLIPHPYVAAGPALTEEGYAPLAYRLEAGLEIDSLHWIARAIGAFDNCHESKDNLPPNPGGHDRYLDAEGYVRPGWRQLFVGLGWKWSELSTTNFAITSNQPQFGGGYDVIHRKCAACSINFSTRLAVNWIVGAKDWRTGSHGPEISLSFPSPRVKGHWFWLGRVGIMSVHDVVTDPSNIPQTLSQRADRSITSYETFGVQYRF